MKERIAVLVIAILLLSVSLIGYADSAGVDNLDTRIHINQLGYKPNDEKVAIISFELSTFNLVDNSTGETVYTGEVTGPVKDRSTGDTVYYADFSLVKDPGEYYVSVPDQGRSYTFNISESVYTDVKDAALKALYFQRCGVALDWQYAGQWYHKACHLTMAYVYDDPTKKIDVSGGWHDAGDYGKYSSPAAKAVADLLLAYELFPEKWGDSLNIPESGNGTPDILDEARFELEWLLKMQDSESGGVYHKVTTKNFPGFIMPERDTGRLYLSPISPTATGDFAAIMAMASRVYEDIDSAFAETMLKAAEKAWVWLDENPYAQNFKNPSGISTGEYGDWSSSDEKFWAAVELYAATGEDMYSDYVKSSYRKSFSKTNLGWGDMGGYGTITYLFMDSGKTDDKVYESLKSDLLAVADRLANSVDKDGYNVSLTSSQYNWGSNMNVMDNAMLLIIANILDPKDEYAKAAEDQLHYLLGRNSLDKSFVTGYGSDPVMNPHHRPSGADGVKDPVPGLVSGGPNSGFQDPGVSKMVPKNTPPAKVFVDHVDSYSTNEITIYWNSPAVFVMGYFDK